ncbi:MAG: winged helix-turn-helix domain-containing protein [Saprospiraceae bacterium]
MAFSKAQSFDPTSYNQSIWSKALAHPARIHILNYLLENGKTPFRQLCKIIPLSSTTISQHIRLLRTYHLIEAEEIVPYTYYKLNRKTCAYLALIITNMHIEFSQLQKGEMD